MDVKCIKGGGGGVTMGNNLYSGPSSFDLIGEGCSEILGKFPTPTPQRSNPTSHPTSAAIT